MTADAVEVLVYEYEDLDYMLKFSMNSDGIRRAYELCKKFPERTHFSDRFLEEHVFFPAAKEAWEDQHKGKILKESLPVKRFYVIAKGIGAADVDVYFTRNETESALNTKLVGRREVDRTYE